MSAKTLTTNKRIQDIKIIQQKLTIDLIKISFFISSMYVYNYIAGWFSGIFIPEVKTFFIFLAIIKIKKRSLKWIMINYI
jgi:hypothetical protein